VGSGTRTALGSGTCLGQEGIGRLAEAEAGEPLAELRELHGKLSRIRGLALTADKTV
jgi:hypothetical protein